jgi:hypothetical protein
MGDLVQAVKSGYVSISFCRDRAEGDRGLGIGLLLKGIDLNQGQLRNRYSLPATAVPQGSQPADEEKVRS